MMTDMAQRQQNCSMTLWWHSRTGPGGVARAFPPLGLRWVGGATNTGCLRTRRRNRDRHRALSG